VTNHRLSNGELFHSLSAITESDPSYQLAVQYPGASLISEWKSSEIVIARESNLTIVVQASDVLELNTNVSNGILDANPGSRVILLLGAQHNFSMRDFLEIHRRAAFSCIRKSVDPFHTARNILAIAGVESFDLVGLSKAFRRRLHDLGFQESENITREQQQYIATARQIAAEMKDETKHDLLLGFNLYVLKSIYPVLRDLSDFRGVLIHGWIFGTAILGYKQSILSQINQDIESVRGLLEAFQPQVEGM
jgi:hypothetical protein